MEKISNDYRENVRVLDGLLGVGRSCDMVSRDYLIGGRRARLWVVDGFGSDSILERMGAFWLTLKPENVVGLTEMQDFLDRYITFSESNVTFDISDAVTSVFLGKSLLAVEGLAGVALMDAKGYPSRSVHEPPDGKVLRGSHDGFVEAVVPNMALLRRRIRDPHLTMEGHKVGSRTHNDAVLCYLDDKVDQDLLRKLRGGVPTTRQELQTFTRTLYQSYQDFYGQVGPAAQRMKEVWFFLIHLFEGGERHDKKMRRLRTPGEYEAVEASIFQELPLRDHAAGAFG